MSWMLSRLKSISKVALASRGRSCGRIQTSRYVGSQDQELEHTSRSGSGTNQRANTHTQLRKHQERFWLLGLWTSGTPRWTWETDQQNTPVARPFLQTPSYLAWTPCLRVRAIGMVSTSNDFTLAHTRRLHTVGHCALLWRGLSTLALPDFGVGGFRWRVLCIVQQSHHWPDPQRILSSHWRLGEPRRSADLTT